MSILNDLRGAKTRAEKFAIAGKFAGVDPNVFDGIWGAESNRGDPKWMLSGAGARGHFGIMPDTQSVWEKRTGTKLNPDNFEDGLFLSALTMQENMRHFKTVDDSLRAYNGSWDRSNWNNEETKAYVGKVLGRSASAPGQPYSNPGRVPGTHSLTLDDLRGLPEGALLNVAPEDVTKLDRAKMRAPSATEMVIGAMATPMGEQYSDNLAPGRKPGDAEEDAAVEHQEWASGLTAWTKYKAAFEDTALTASMLRAVTREYNPEDPAWLKYYGQNANEIEKFAETEEEAKWMRDSKSEQDLMRIKADIVAQRDRRRIYTSGGTGEAIGYGLAAGISDPASWAVGMGVGKAFSLAGVGSKVLMAGRAGTVARELSVVESIASGGIRAIPGVAAQAPNKALGAASIVAENALGNVLTDAAIDALGERRSPEDYALDASVGALIAIPQIGFQWRYTPDAGLQKWALENRENAARESYELGLEAQREAGPDATPEQIQAAVGRITRQRVVDEIRTSLAPVPDENRFLPEATEPLAPEAEAGDTVDVKPKAGKGKTKPKPPAHTEPTYLTQDPALRADIDTRYDLAQISDDAERAMVAEKIARAEQMVKANPLDENHEGFNLLGKIKAGDSTGRGMESTGLTLLNSDSVVARAASMMLLEGTTGKGGRRRTASMASTIRQRLYMEAIAGYDDDYHAFRRATGTNVLTEALNGRQRNAFNERVFLDVEARNGYGVRDVDPNVRRAADKWERGMDLMRMEQQHVGTVGAARLGPDSVGYMTHRLDGRKVAGLKPDQQKAIRNILSEQFQAEENGFDKPFADKLAAKYLEQAMGRAKGNFDVPLNLHDPEAADIIRDALTGFKMAEADIEAVMGKFSRGGASHTKKRLRLDLSKPIPDGKGGTMPLAKLYNMDVPLLYRGYARRVAGEVALAQYGIMGKKGLAVLRKGIEATGGSKADLSAFDQIAAEFLNQPFGDHNHIAFDNLRQVTSLTRLGGMGFTQFGEYGNAIGTLGLMRTFSAIASMPRLLKEIGQIKAGGAAKNPILDSLETLGGKFGMDDFQLTRMFDGPDRELELYGPDSVGAFTRAVRAGANLQAVLSFHRAVTAVQVRGMAEQIVHKAMRYIKEGKDDIALDDMGIDKALRTKLHNAMALDPGFVEFDSMGRLTKLDMNAASSLTPADMMDLRFAIERGASQIIQRTYIGETGKWAHNGFLKVLMQFRTFGLTSIEKQWGRNNRNYGPIKSFAMLLGAMSFAVPIMAARHHAKMIGMSRSEQEKYKEKNFGWQQWARGSLNYASASGLSGDIYDVGMGLFSDIGTNLGWEGAEKIKDSVGARGQGQGKLLGGVMAPGATILEDAWGASRLDTDKLQRVTPFGSLPWVQPLFNFLPDEDD